MPTMRFIGMNAGCRILEPDGTIHVGFVSPNIPKVFASLNCPTPFVEHETASLGEPLNLAGGACNPRYRKTWNRHHFASVGDYTSYYYSFTSFTPTPHPIYPETTESVLQLGGPLTRSCCYQASENICPSNFTGDGGRNNCVATCFAPYCPTGYTFNTTTGLCESTFNPGILFTGPKCDLDVAPRRLYVGYHTSPGIRLKRAANDIPPYEFNSVATTPGALSDYEPCVALRTKTPARLLLAFTRNDGVSTVRVWLQDSADRGTTWEAPVQMFTANAKHPIVMCDRQGFTLVAAYNLSDGRIIAKVLGPGESVYGAEFNFQYWTGSALANIIVSDDTFDVHFSDGLEVKWLLVCKPTTPSVGGVVRTFYSNDKGKTWELTVD